MKEQSIFRFIKRGIVLLTLSVWVLPSISVAQQYNDPGILQKTIDRKPVEYTSPGVRLGSFQLNTGAELAWENNDNIFYLDNLEISDSIVHARPWLNLNSDWNRHALNFSAFFDIGSYSDFNSQNYTDSVFNLNGRIDVKLRSAFNYKASYMNLHEDRSDPDGRYGVEPTTFNLSGIDVDYAHTFNRLAAALGYRLQDHNYDNNINLVGDTIDHQDRDRTRDELWLRLGYEYSEKSTFFLRYAGNKVDYDQKFDNNGFDRSSDGYDARGGVKWNMTGVLTGDLYLNYISQDYDDPRFNKVNGWGIGAGLDWTPTQLTSVTIRFANTPQETTQTNTSGYFSQLYSARVQHELRRNILLNARVSYTDNTYEYNGSDTVSSLNNTDVTRGDLGITYLINRHFYLSGGYVYEKQDANTSIFEYQTNRWFITLGGEL